MAKVKDTLTAIQTCSICSGVGYQGWISADGDFDFEFCECNPHGLIIGEDF